jgi:DNA helicase-2/ATP-dependent DNA helicase PcrA
MLEESGLNKKTSTRPSPLKGRASERSDEIVAGLNEVQAEACIHKEGPMVVFAGAGSGKTRIITHRIAWLIEQGVPPWEILAVTFTNKAAGEMRSRVDELSPYSKRVLIATFHSACARWLREFAPELGFTSDFSIYDDKDQLAAIKLILKELNVKLDDETSAMDYKQAIGKMKTMAMLPSDPRLHAEYIDLMPPVGVQVYQRYQELLASCNAMDFGDLLMNMLLLLKRNERVRETMQRRYRFIMVDEYQDTNRTQFELISRLAERHKNLVVVGDDDQSIYSWRGAVPANIIDFDKNYAGAKKVTMEQNYRCTRHIVEAANAMILNNKQRVPKRLFTENPDGELITYRLETDNDMEAWHVVDSINSEMSTYDLADTAIFYRTNAQSRVMEDALRRENISYQIFGTVRFYDRMEVKDVMSWMRLVVNPADDMSLKRIINTPTRGIGQKAIDTIAAEAARREISMLETVQAMVLEKTPRLAPKLQVFLTLYETIKEEILACPLDEIVEVILNHTKYLDYVEKRFPEQSVDKIENIHELGSALSEFEQYQEGDEPVSLSDWLQTVTLSSEQSEDNGGVSLMTMHMAKGLEFRRVYILGLEEGLLPHRNSLDDPASLEEERRLFYVGLTRAMDKVSLVGAYRRRTYTNWTANRPSRFLSEIPNEHFQPVTEMEHAILRQSEDKPVRDDGETYYEYDADPAAPSADFQIGPGMAVRHPTYGKGIVSEITDEFGVIKVVVKFHEFGMRKVAGHHLMMI